MSAPTQAPASSCWINLAFLLTLFAGLWPGPAPALAQTERAIAVVMAGGTRHAQVLDLEGHQGPGQVVTLGHIELLATHLGPSVINDLKILPDGGHLLAHAGGRGFVITDSGGELQFSLSAAGEMPVVSSASVASYSGAGEPSHVLFTDNATSLAHVYDLRNRRFAISHNFVLPGARGELVQGIVLPEQRIAVAVNWRSLQTSAIDVISIGSSTGPGQSPSRRRYANRDNGESDTTVVAELDDLRDIMALAGGNLLVTTREQVFELAHDGTIVWTFDGLEELGVNGEFASARWLGPGQIAVATFEPGLWTRPHTNHRVHWIDTSSLTLLGSSAPLDAAPVRLEVLFGHGGTGTFGFDAGLHDIPRGDPALVVLTEPLELNDEAFRPGFHIEGQAALHNGGTDTVALQRAAVMAEPAPCNSPQAEPRQLFATLSPVIEPGATQPLTGSHLVSASFAVGTWCAYVVIVDDANRTHRLGEPVPFEILESDTTRPPPVQIQDLGVFDDAPTSDDVGFDLFEPDVPELEPSCACASTQASDSAPPLLLLLAGLVLLRVRCRGYGK